MNQFPMNLPPSGRLPDEAERDALLEEIQRYEIPDVLLIAADGATPDAMIAEISKEMGWMPVGVARWEGGVGPAARSLALLLQYIHLALPRTRVHLAGFGVGGYVAAAATVACMEPVLSTLTLVRPAISPFAFASYGALHRLIGRRLVLGPTVVLFTRTPASVGMGRTGAHGLDENQSVVLGVEDLATVTANAHRPVLNLLGEATPGNVAALLRSLCCREDTVPPLRRSKPVRRSTRKTASRPALTLVAPPVPVCLDAPPSTESECNAPNR